MIAKKKHVWFVLVGHVLECTTLSQQLLIGRKISRLFIHELFMVKPINERLLTAKLLFLSLQLLLFPPEKLTVVFSLAIRHRIFHIYYINWTKAINSHSRNYSSLIHIEIVCYFILNAFWRLLCILDEKTVFVYFLWNWFEWCKLNDRAALIAFRQLSRWRKWERKKSYLERMPYICTSSKKNK